MLTIGASPARTRVTFCTHKKSPKKRRETRTPFFAQPVGIRFAAAQPLSQFLLASDLQRVSRPTSAVALLKGEANLRFFAGHLRLWERFFPPARSPRGAAAAAYATNMPPACLLNAAGPTGEVRDPPHRLRSSRRQRGISVATGHLPCRRPVEQSGGPARRGPAPFGDFWAIKSHPPEANSLKG